MQTPELFLMLLAILVSSLVGSAHCVGMCGPFAVLVSRRNEDGHGQTADLAFYHFGRGVTYASLGVLAGWTGTWFNLAGSLLGWQQLAARITGIAMIVFGLLAIARLVRVGSLHLKVPTFFTPIIQRLYRRSSRFSPRWRAMAVGSVTGLLPCGWLYAFVLLAVGTSQPLLGATVMLVFWLGTIPALSIFSVGLQQLSYARRQLVPYVTACLMILGGLFTASYRAEAALETLIQQPAPAGEYEQYLNGLQETSLPCCHPQAETSGSVPSTSVEVPACCRQ
ncbi:MAG: hypothetical protein CMJ47_13660 [Planctomyces sp.]|nr:hypothetical protein [Planctomyces sp.]